MNRAIIIPHYNTPRKLSDLLSTIPVEHHEGILIVDDASTTGTPDFKGNIVQHKERMGYGAAQKTGYQWALENNFDQILLVHGDNQYSFKHLWEAAQSCTGFCLGSRLLYDGAATMPLWRKGGNRLLTSFANLLFHTEHSDLHSGARIFSTGVLQNIPFMDFSDGFLFDQQILSHCLSTGIAISEFSIPTDYSEGVSSISGRESIRYALGSVFTLIQSKLQSGPNGKH